MISIIEKELNVLAVSEEVPTVASMARDWAQKIPNQVAMREKDLGIWKEYTWEQTWDLILQAAHGLLALGVKAGDRISIQAEDRPEWVILDLAIVAVRGITVGLYPTNPTAEVEYLLNDCAASVHLAEDQEQVDRVLAIDRSNLDCLTHIIYCNSRGIGNYDDNRLLSWENFLDLGCEHRKANPSAVSSVMSEAESADVMTLVYTSGTTGPPKGAMLTNANASFAIQTIVNSEEIRGKKVSPKDIVLTYLPLCHVAERVFSTWHLVAQSVQLNFAE